MVMLAYAIATAMVLAWIGITIWALLWDRARGRRRCPRCFYEIDTASGRKCTECGRVARSERALGKTRRRWRTAIVATVLLLGPALTAATWAWLTHNNGWPGVPTAIATRLLWLNNADHDADVIERIRSGRLSRADAERVVLAACRRLDSDDPLRRASGFDLLFAIDRFDARLSSDPPNTRRALLEELRPDRSIPALIRLSRSADDAEAAKALRAMTSLRDISDDVLLAIVDQMGAASSEVRQAARMAAMFYIAPNAHTRRFAPAPQDLFTGGGDSSTTTAARFTRRVRELAHDRAALLEWLEAAAMDDDSINDPEWMHRRMALWLFCRLAKYDVVALDAVEAALGVPHEFLVAITVHQLQGFAWSPRIEHGLRAAIHHQSARVNHEAIRSAATFKHDAASLIPDFIEYAARPDRQSGSNAFVEFFRMIGGDPKDLLPVVHARLTALADQADAAGLGINGRWIRNPPMASLHWLWISTMDVEDPDKAELAAKYVRLESYQESALEALVAFAVLSGDRAATTSLVIERNPSLHEAVNPQFPNPPLIRLFRLNLVEVDRLIEHYASSGDPMERAAVARLMTRHLSAEQLAPLAPLLNRLATNPDPVLREAAARAKERMAQ